MKARSEEATTTTTTASSPSYPEKLLSRLSIYEYTPNETLIREALGLDEWEKRMKARATIPAAIISSAPSSAGK